MASWLYSLPVLRNVVRAGLLLPAMMSAVTVGYVWSIIYSPIGGPLDSVMSALGLVLGLTIPEFVFLIPLYLLMHRLGLLNTYPSVILAFSAMNLSFAVFFLHRLLEVYPTGDRRGRGARWLQPAWHLLACDIAIAPPCHGDRQHPGLDQRLERPCDPAPFLAVGQEHCHGGDLRFHQLGNREGVRYIRGIPSGSIGCGSTVHYLLATAAPYHCGDYCGSW